MQELERYLDAVCRSLSGSADLRRHLREELRAHLEAAVAAHRAEGLSDAEAVARAIAEFGDSQQVRSELQGVYGQRLLALFIERAMDWKVRTMKNDWKWSFTAHLTLLATIVVLAAWMCSVMVFVTPIVVEQYHTLDASVPDYFGRTIAIAGFVHAYLAIWIALAVLGVVVFEWRCRRDYKGTIRLAMGATLVLALAVAAATETAAVGVAWVQVSRQTRRAQTPPPGLVHPPMAPADQASS